MENLVVALSRSSYWRFSVSLPSKTYPGKLETKSSGVVAVDFEKAAAKIRRVFPACRMLSLTHVGYVEEEPAAGRPGSSVLE